MSYCKLQCVLFVITTCTTVDHRNNRQFRAEFDLLLLSIDLAKERVVK